MLKKQLKEVQKGIENMLTAIQMGIITPSTKERLEELERQKSHLSIEITKEEMAHPVLERDEILFWLKRFRELDTTKLAHRRRLIDSFVNSIILFDDHLIFTGNYKDSTNTITFAEIEAAGLSSDLTASLGPIKSSEIERFQSFFAFYRLFYRQKVRRKNSAVSGCVEWRWNEQIFVSLRTDFRG